MQIVGSEFSSIMNSFGVPSNNESVFQFILVRNKAIFKTDRQSHTINQDSMFLCSPNTSVQILSQNAPLIVSFVSFLPDKEELSRLSSLPLSINEPSIPPNFNELSNLLRAIYQLFYSGDKYRIEKLEHHLWNLIYSIASGDEDSHHLHGQNLLYWQLRQLRKQISDDPNTFSGVEEAARSIGLSTSRFQHIYKQTFHINYLQDVIHVRTKRAKALLQTTNWTISKIAQELGYKNETFFYRQFRKQVGVTPSEYRGTDTLFF